MYLYIGISVAAIIGIIFLILIGWLIWMRFFKKKKERYCGKPTYCGGPLLVYDVERDENQGCGVVKWY